MTRFDRGTLTCPRLVDYFLQACKPKDRWLVGMEVEKMGVDAATGRAIPYDGPGPSVVAVLDFYHAQRDGERIYQGDRLIGIDGPWGEISLEPGGQVEWSSRPMPDLGALGRALEEHLDTMDRAARTLGVRWLPVGVHPEQPVEEMPWMPKARYALMREYLGRTGRLAHRMMTQTSGVQCAFDYDSAEDWARKFRASALISPIAVALFANSSRVDGRDSGYRSYRQAIWRDVDPARCGLPSIVFEPGFGIEAWVEWVCDVPAIFRHRGQGLASAGGTPFRRYLERAGCEAVGIEDWELHLSSVFTEVRSYTYIEVRCADLQPDPRILAVPAFWTGLLYGSGTVDAALALGRDHDRHDLWLEAMDSAARQGLDGTAGGRPLRDLASRALELSIASLAGGAACAGDPERSADTLREVRETLDAKVTRASP